VLARGSLRFLSTVVGEGHDHRDHQDRRSDDAGLDAEVPAADDVAGTGRGAEREPRRRLGSAADGKPVDVALEVVPPGVQPGDEPVVAPAERDEAGEHGVERDATGTIGRKSSTPIVIMTAPMTKPRAQLADRVVTAEADRREGAALLDADPQEQPDQGRAEGDELDELAERVLLTWVAEDECTDGASGAGATDHDDDGDDPREPSASRRLGLRVRCTRGPRSNVHAQLSRSARAAS